jgi:glycosyltransferase involved in cell wall biosynthesis
MIEQSGPQKLEGEINTVAEIDVVIPAYNCERYIADSLQSIQNQTIENVRIIVVDDGSTDGTAHIIKRLSNSDSRILYLYQENSGIVEALNAGLAMCDAPFIARMDGDDISHPDRFKKEINYLSANPDCVAVAGLVRHIDEDGRFYGHVTRVKDVSTISNNSLPANEPSLIHPMLMVRAEAMRQAGGFRHVYNAEDTDLYWRLSDMGRLHAIPDIVGDYRIHSASLSSSSIENGRQQAIWSQLTALSDQRRKSGKPDIPFSAELAHKIRRHRELKDIVKEANNLAYPEEIQWLTSAVAAKIIEMSYYRPYEVSAEDIKYIKYARQFDRLIDRRDGYEIFREGIISAGIRLILTHRVKDAFDLVPLSSWPILAGRAAFRGLLSPELRRRVKSLIKS